jgi:allophanate hydrolase subunit 1
MEKTDKTIIIDLAKSLHKAIYKALNSKRKLDPVADVLDSNRTKEVEEHKVPVRNVSVMYKTEEVAHKLAEFVVKKYLDSKKDNL